MKKEYWNKPNMDLWERLYLLEIVRGLCITGSVFFGNMWKWLTFRKGALTAYYPEEIRADYSSANRGRHILVQRENGQPQCVSCNMCATVCPAYCIEIQSAPPLDDPFHRDSGAGDVPAGGLAGGENLAVGAVERGGVIMHLRGIHRAANPFEGDTGLLGDLM